MATSYPSGLDNFSTLTDNVSLAEASTPNNLGDSIEQLQVKLGVDSSAVITTIDYFLKHASGAYRIHQHDGSSDDGAKLDWDACWTDAVHDHSSNAEGGTIADFTPTKSGDWILSSATTARTGWTNVSATYANKFIRLSATPLTTGGADTHVHAAATSGSTTLTVAQIPTHTHDVGGGDGSGWSGMSSAGNALLRQSGSTGGSSSHSHSVGETASANNVPAYVQTVVFQKD